MALGLLMILFVGMSVISIVGLLLMYLLKGERAKAFAFYVMAVWGMGVAALSATSLPSNFTGHQILAWGLGFLSVAGLLVHIGSKNKSGRMTAYLLVTVSVICGVLKMFVFSM